jgi:hypothetical protein
MALLRFLSQPRTDEAKEGAARETRADALLRPPANVSTTIAESPM